ncbi:hypothetical protein [Arthrobacter sp. 2MCAF14]
MSPSQTRLAHPRRQGTSQAYRRVVAGATIGTASTAEIPVSA